MYFKQGAISTLSGKPLKLVDYFACLSSNISSTESNVNMHNGKAFNRLITIQKTDLSDDIKWDFFQALVVLVLLNSNKIHREKARWELHKNATYCFEQKLQLYCYLPPIWQTIQGKWTRHTWPYWKSKVKLISIVLLWTLTETYQCWPNSKDLHSSALCGHWMLSQGPTKSDGWQRKIAWIS